MRTWNANFASVGRWFAKKCLAKTLATLATLLLLTAGWRWPNPLKRAVRRLLSCLTFLRFHSSA